MYNYAFINIEVIVSQVCVFLLNINMSKFGSFFNNKNQHLPSGTKTFSSASFISDSNSTYLKTLGRPNTLSFSVFEMKR